MRVSIITVQTLVRLAGLTLFVLGVLFWTGHALTLIRLHMQVGLLFTISLLALAVLAVRAGVSPGLASLTFLWGLVVPVVGMTQDRMLPGDAHWVIQALHLLVGLLAIALAERVNAVIKRAGRLDHQHVHATSERFTAG